MSILEPTLQHAIVSMVFFVTCERPMFLLHYVEVKVRSFHAVIYLALEDEQATHHDIENLQPVGHGDAAGGEFHKCWR